MSQAGEVRLGKSDWEVNLGKSFQRSHTGNIRSEKSDWGSPFDDICMPCRATATSISSKHLYLRIK